MDSTSVLLAGGGFFAGALVAWGLTRNALLREKVQLQERASQIPTLQNRIAELEAAREKMHASMADMRAESATLNANRERDREAAESFERRHASLEAEITKIRERLATTEIELAAARTERDAAREQVRSSEAVLEQAKAAMGQQFQLLANEILESKSVKFGEQNKTQVDQLLEPLRAQLKDFRAKVEDIHLKDVQQQAALAVELDQIKSLNRQLTDEAHGLATALRGQSKMQGNWGELVLENVLERSGLRAGEDYRREVSFDTDNGRQRPDVIVYLPQGKHLVIDAKVSLNAYTRYVNGESEAEKVIALRDHVTAIGNRIRELSDRNYFDIPGLNSPEVVFMFVPIESAFVEALRADESLLQRAIEKNILVATPTTLLTSLNIVRQLWRFEEQNKTTQELAERASKVHKKLNTFLQSMQQIGLALDRAKTIYSTACGQLFSGKDNLIKQANDFERLGVSVQGQLPEQFVRRAELELDYMPEALEPEATDESVA